jgi:lipid-A-disaccharide synthase-like uncharacterized protein
MKHYNGMRSISATATIALLVGSCLWSIRPFRFVIAWIQLECNRRPPMPQLEVTPVSLLNDSNLHSNQIVRRMSSSQVIRFHKYIVTPQVFYKTTSSYGIVNMRPLIRE